MNKREHNPLKTVLILGGTSDIGVAIAENFASNGFQILLAGRNMAYLNRVARDLEIRTGANAKVCHFDAREYKSHTETYLKMNSPDVGICVFGYLGEQLKGEHDWDEAEKIIDVNYKGAVSIFNIMAEDFAWRGSGTLIGISSVAGDRGRQSNYLYGSAKAGFTAYLSGLRNRLDSLGVQVITIKPGFVKTKMTEDFDLPEMLTAQPKDIAKTVFLAYVRNQNVVYAPQIWRLIMFVIKSIPESIFKRLKL